MAFKRLFIGIELNDTARETIVRHAAVIERVAKENLRWERAAKLHITLKFLGDVDEGIVPKLQAGLKEAAAGLPAFQAILEGTGNPKGGKVRVIWLNVWPSPELAKVHKAVEALCQSLGFAIEKRPFRPHVTIARMRRGRPGEASIEASAERGFGPVIFPVSNLTLFESELTPGGSVYTIISRYRLAG